MSQNSGKWLAQYPEANNEVKIVSDSPKPENIHFILGIKHRKAASRHN